MLFIFDLDFTLWNCGGTWCDHTNPPYKKLNNNTISDRDNLQIRIYPETIQVLNELKKREIPIAAASRTSAPEWAGQLLKLFDIERFFTYKEIYPGSKMVHMGNIQRESGLKYKQMFFFDDEFRNINDVQPLGVNCYFVEDGINMKILNRALEKSKEL